ncbi:MAG TPA: TonB-dependent receptor, partial [Caldithrix sp.]|nr:TonB-dependent receptor [Caldithrix sp.]
MYNLFKILGFSLIFLITSLAAQSSSKGKISGTAVDAETGDPLIGANVYLENTSLGSASDLDGNFFIAGVPVGNYVLIISVIGYAETKITDVTVKPNEVTKIEIAVQPEILTTDVVIVEAEALQNTEASLLKSRQKSASVSDAISAEEISKSGSGDAASAMKKVTGASVVGGKYVYIRGLGERYSATTLNGAELPSADPDKKSFQLDLIPSNMLDNINTIKTFTPDKSGTFTGGLVDISLKSYPEQFTFQINSSTGYNSQATGNNNFILPNSGGTDWLGMDDGTRDIPNIVKNKSGDIGKINSLSNDTQEGLDEVLFVDKLSNSFNNKMIPTKANAPLNSSFGISIGNTLVLDEKQNNSLGYFGSVTWGQNYSFVDNEVEGRYKLVGPLSEVEGLEADFEGTGSKGTMEVNWGSIANLALKNRTLGQVKFSYMHTQSAEATGQYLIGVRERDRSTDKFETTVSKWVERSLDSYQLDGDHIISPVLNSKLDWKVSKSVNNQLEPDQRYFFDVLVGQPDGSTIFQFDAANSQPISRYYRDLTEDNLSAYTNLEFTFRQWSNHNSKLKLGFALNQVNRAYNQRRFDYIPNRLSLNDFAENNKLNTQNLFNTMGISDSTSRPDRPSRWFDNSFVIDEAIDSTGFFRGDLETFAYYLMVDLPVFEKLRFIGGARIETTTMSSKTLDASDGKGKLADTDVLPSLNLVYNLYKNMNLRTAISRTVAR